MKFFCSWSLLSKSCDQRMVRFLMVTVVMVKRQWEKNIYSHAFQKMVIFKICKGIKQCNSRKPNLILNGAKNIHRHLSSKGIHIINMYIRKFSTSLLIRKMRVKTTTKYHFISVRMDSIKETQGSWHVEQQWRCPVQHLPPTLKCLKSSFSSAPDGASC